MGRMYVSGVLLSISAKSQPDKVADVELKPIVPGAWAAWAKRSEAEPTRQAAQTAVAPSPAIATLKPSGSKA